MLNNSQLLRFIAASSVIVAHAYTLNRIPDIIEQKSLGLFPTGQIAVYVFFIISGYSVLQSRLKSDSVLSYLQKRALRIFPGLAASLLVTIVVFGSLSTTEGLRSYFTNPETWRYLNNMKLYPATAYLLPGVFTGNPAPEVNGALWTLAYEFTMYVFVILAAFVIAVRGGRYLFALLFGLFFVACCGFHSYIADFGKLRILHLNLYELVNFGIFFSLGMLAYLYRDELPMKGWLAVGAVALWLGMYVLSSEMGYFPLVSINWVRYFSLSYLVMYLCSLPGRCAGFGKHGDYSYGMYIYGYPVQQLIIQYLGARLEIYQQILLAFVLVFPLAWLSWHFVEKPALRYKKYLVKQPESTGH